MRNMFKRLPKSIKKRAFKIDNEYVVKLSDVEGIVDIARKERIAVLGGQAQFRFPDATCEMYWINADPEPKDKKESWDDYVERSTSEFINLFKSNVLAKNFVQEAKNWPVIVEKKRNGFKILDHLYFVIYFQREEAK